MNDEVPDPRLDGAAECKKWDPEIFFPPRGDRVLRDLAKRICDHCPLKAACLDYAISVPAKDDHGIWGGATEAERRRLRAGEPAEPSPRARTVEQVDRDARVRELAASGASGAEIARTLEISVRTVWRALEGTGTGPLRRNPRDLAARLAS